MAEDKQKLLDEAVASGDYTKAEKLADEICRDNGTDTSEEYTPKRFAGMIQSSPLRENGSVSVYTPSRVSVWKRLLTAAACLILAAGGILTFMITKNFSKEPDPAPALDSGVLAQYVQISFYVTGEEPFCYTVSSSGSGCVYDNGETKFFTSSETFFNTTVSYMLNCDVEMFEPDAYYEWNKKAYFCLTDRIGEKKFYFVPNKQGADGDYEPKTAQETIDGLLSAYEKADKTFAENIPLCYLSLTYGDESDHLSVNTEPTDYYDNKLTFTTKVSTVDNENVVSLTTSNEAFAVSDAVVQTIVSDFSKAGALDPRVCIFTDAAFCGMFGNIICETVIANVNLTPELSFSFRIYCNGALSRNTPARKICMFAEELVQKYRYLPYTSFVYIEASDAGSSGSPVPSWSFTAKGGESPMLIHAGSAAASISKTDYSSLESVVQTIAKDQNNSCDPWLNDPQLNDSDCHTVLLKALCDNGRIFEYGGYYMPKYLLRDINTEDYFLSSSVNDALYSMFGPMMTARRISEKISRFADIPDGVWYISLILQNGKTYVFDLQNRLIYNSDTDSASDMFNLIGEFSQEEANKMIDASKDIEESNTETGGIRVCTISSLSSVISARPSDELVELLSGIARIDITKPEITGTDICTLFYHPFGGNSVDKAELDFGKMTLQCGRGSFEFGSNYGNEIADGIKKVFETCRIGSFTETPGVNWTSVCIGNESFSVNDNGQIAQYLYFITLESDAENLRFEEILINDLNSALYINAFINYKDYYYHISVMEGTEEWEAEAYKYYEGYLDESTDEAYALKKLSILAADSTEVDDENYSSIVIRFLNTEKTINSDSWEAIEIRDMLMSFIARGKRTNA